jgi:hypothetical protein
MQIQKNDDLINKIMNDPEQVRKILNSAINDALLKHKQAGNPVCGFKEGKVYWVESQKINPVEDI